jgi:hypothetical protein
MVYSMLVIGAAATAAAAGKWHHFQEFKLICSKAMLGFQAAAPTAPVAAAACAAGKTSRGYLQTTTANGAQPLHVRKQFKQASDIFSAGSNTHIAVQSNMIQGGS